MARIQILELPSEVVGDYVRTPFAVVIDQLEGLKIESHAGTEIVSYVEINDLAIDRIKTQLGAMGVITAPGTLDVVRG